MLNYDFRNSTKRCSKCDRVLQPGEEFYSALIEEGDDSVRLDFSPECWDGPPENCIGWWKTSIAPRDKSRIYWASREQLLAYFDEVRQHTETADLAYMTALLLAQKRILSTKETLHEPDESILRLENRRDKIDYEIPVVEIPPARMKEIQDELTEKLFTDRPESDDGDKEPHEE